MRLSLVALAASIIASTLGLPFFPSPRQRDGMSLRQAWHSIGFERRHKRMEREARDSYIKNFARYQAAAKLWIPLTTPEDEIQLSITYQELLTPVYIRLESQRCRQLLNMATVDHSTHEDCVKKLEKFHLSETAREEERKAHMLASDPPPPYIREAI